MFLPVNNNSMELEYVYSPANMNSMKLETSLPENRNDMNNFEFIPIIEDFFLNLERKK